MDGKEERDSSKQESQVSATPSGGHGNTASATSGAGNSNLTASSNVYDAVTSESKVTTELTDADTTSDKPRGKVDTRSARERAIDKKWGVNTQGYDWFEGDGQKYDYADNRGYIRSSRPGWVEALKEKAGLSSS
ncbi:hypothetical protein V865_001225 [Kwoniella europaea PYCC6329]|uniref:Uncharacterized protein n=1 Tax=Kwoniella europaea PYCC6329 TaxID=1423913 RepID=A0AAX4KBB9_9TREE